MDGSHHKPEHAGLFAAMPDIAQELQDHPIISRLSDWHAMPAPPRVELFTALFQDRPVLVKRWRKAKPWTWVNMAASEINRLSPQMGASVGEVLAQEPQLGLLVTTHSPGTLLQDALIDSSADERAQLTTLALDWLVAYVAQSELQPGGFAPKTWMARSTTRW